ncbi:MBL fold metallo-hydrolase [Sphingomonas sp. Leaf208]|uniref:ribonuclease J n=1 Tax=Sphingomonas sp. Leaf208 TaxID=1735679 RepID=UPI0006F9D5BC|nr:ribonuclease J [Sphingomonas sp. Leaf208]KQM56489.1 MBL fold metallo-hydrolase [Sphingomonas sp. Leaf208]
MTPKNELLFCGLGGSGEIGMNVNLYGCQGKWVMVDLGITFADPQYPGVDVILPDLSFIEDRIDDLLGIVITHGHEDHIGSLPYLAEDLGVPIYATPFTMGLIRGKLEEEGIANRVKLKMIPMGGNFQLGPFGFTFVEMSHSIPEANALLIDTPYGRVFHTGDWKLDKNPVIGNPTTPEGFMAIGDKGVDVLVCDSTNIFNTAASGSESTVREGLFEEVSKAKGRVMITSFASNAARLHTFGEVAKETGRKLCVTGRSLDRIIKVARATGYLKDFPDTISPDEAMRLPKNKVLIIATGGQGEERAALARVANGQHTITLEADDTVIFSSKQIPGNEVQIGRIQNTLAAKGIRMITERQAHVHVSGHPGQPELAQMYYWLRPEVLVPTHGEMRHMMEHARFGLEQGIPRAIVQSNGDIIRLAPKGPAKIGNATVGRLVLDGDVILPADGATLSERRKLAINGQISVGVALGKDGRMVGQPQVRVQGVPVEEDRAAFIADAVQAAADTVRGGKRESEKMREQIRLAVRKVAKRWTGKQPIVDVLLIEA